MPLPTYNPNQHVPPPPPLATLTITPKGVLHLHASLRQALGIRPGQPIDLIPPTWNSLFWHLDLRAHAARRVLWYNDTRVRAKGILLPPGLVTANLTFHLLPGPPAHPDYYPLLPAHALPAH